VWRRFTCSHSHCEGSREDELIPLCWQIAKLTELIQKNNLPGHDKKLALLKVCRVEGSPLLARRSHVSRLPRSCELVSYARMCPSTVPHLGGACQCVGRVRQRRLQHRLPVLQLL
jgi:hypothetical protein